MLANLLTTVNQMNNAHPLLRRYEHRKKLLETLSAPKTENALSATLDDVDFLNEDLLKQAILHLQKRATDHAFLEPGTIAAANDRANNVAAGIESALCDADIAAALQNSVAPSLLLHPKMQDVSLPSWQTADVLAENAGEFPAFQ